MSFAEDDPKLEFMSIEEATSPPGGLINHLKDRWWMVHPTKGLIFYRPDKKWSKPGSPQCNSNKEVCEHGIKTMFPWAEVKFYPSVFHSIRPQDYVS